MTYYDNSGNTQRPVSNADINRLKKAIDINNSKIQQFYVQIGELYCEMYKDNPAPEFKDYVNIILGAQKEIDQTNEAIRHMKGVHLCAKCGGEYPMGYAFCPTCGSPAPKQDRPVVQMNLCKVCGARLSDENKFCTTCGTPVDFQKSAEPIATTPVAAAVTVAVTEPVVSAVQAPAVESAPVVEPEPVVEEVPKVVSVEEPAIVAEPEPEVVAAPVVETESEDKFAFETVAAMFCENCGVKIDTDSVFCENCGAKVEDEVVPEPEVAAPAPVAEFLFCENCGSKLEVDSTFCTECGAKV